MKKMRMAKTLSLALALLTLTVSLFPALAAEAEPAYGWQDGLLYLHDVDMVFTPPKGARVATGEELAGFSGFLAAAGPLQMQSIFHAAAIKLGCDCIIIACDDLEGEPEAYIEQFMATKPGGPKFNEAYLAVRDATLAGRDVVQVYDGDGMLIYWIPRENGAYMLELFASEKAKADSFTQFKADLLARMGAE